MGEEHQIQIPSSAQMDDIKDILETMMSDQVYIKNSQSAVEGKVDITLSEVKNQATVLSMGQVTYAALLRPDNTTSYTAGDVVGMEHPWVLNFQNVSPNSGDMFTILNATLMVNAQDTSSTPVTMDIPAGMDNFRLHLYSEDPVNMEDNEPYNLFPEDRNHYLGFIHIADVVDLGHTLFAQATDVNLTGKLADDDTSIYGILQTVDSYEPDAETEYSLSLVVKQVKHSPIGG